MMQHSLITLTTDFGEGSSYVAAMKGVVLSINPDVRLVDITHAIPPQDIRRGAMVLAEATPLFPAGSLHIAVVDPGVGAAREIVYVEIAGQRYIGPDNGLFSTGSHRGTILSAARGADVPRSRHYGARRRTLEPGTRPR
jgi:S-adenosylmethionine hydrolase